MGPGRALLDFILNGLHTPTGTGPPRRTLRYPAPVILIVIDHMPAKTSAMGSSCPPGHEVLPHQPQTI